MFIGRNDLNKADRYRNTAQSASGPFLILFASERRDPTTGLYPIYGVVREVSLHRDRVDDSMVGKVRIGGRTINLSGNFGADGNPHALEYLWPEDMKHLTRMPDDLLRRFWKHRIALEFDKAPKLWTQRLPGGRAPDRRPGVLLGRELRAWGLGLAGAKRTTGARRTADSVCRSASTGRYRRC